MIDCRLARWSSPCHPGQVTPRCVHYTTAVAFGRTSIADDARCTTPIPIQSVHIQYIRYLSLVYRSMSFCEVQRTRSLVCCLLHLIDVVPEYGCWCCRKAHFCHGASTTRQRDVLLLLLLLLLLLHALSRENDLIGRSTNLTR